MKQLRNKLALGVACLWLAFALPAVPPAPATAQEGWTELANLPSAAWSISPDPSSPASLYALSNSGISHTSDGGATWAVCGPQATMMRLVAPARGQEGAPLLYASGPLGLRVSGDGCTTWRDVPAQAIAPSSAHVRLLAPYPNNTSVLYAGMDGLGGLYRSIDAGATWQAASKGLPPNAWITTLTADPLKPEAILVGLDYTTRSHPPASVYKSLDGGLTWRSSSMGLHMLPNNGGSVVGLGWSGEILFAATSDSGLYKSGDRGASWRAAVVPRSARQATPSAGSPTPLPLAITSFVADPDGALLLGTEEGAYRSSDGGQTWQAFGPAATQGKAALLAMDPGSGKVAILAGETAYSATLPPGGVSLPIQPVATPTALPPTPPVVNPPTYTPTPPATLMPVPPTTTPVPTATPTPTAALVEGPKPTDRVQPLDPAVSSYFEATGHNIKYGFRDFWQANGGLGRFGYPLTEEFVEGGVPVQYFERARFEYRDGHVELGRIGTELAQGQGGQAFLPIPFFVSEESKIYFGPTKHSVSGPFLDFFRANGRIDGLGYPISESYLVDKDTEVQWFERSRFEWHRALPEGKRITLANIGTELLQRRGWVR